MIKSTTSAAIGALLTLLLAQPAFADRHGDGVRSCSRFGNGCVSGAVRHGPSGREVRLPGGTWIGCAGDCHRTLADETIDFWDKRSQERGGRR